MPPLLKCRLPAPCLSHQYVVKGGSRAIVQVFDPLLLQLRIRIFQRRLGLQSRALHEGRQCPIRVEYSQVETQSLSFFGSVLVRGKVGLL